MRKLMMVSALVVATISANAQRFGNDNAPYGDRGGDKIGRYDERNDREAYRGGDRYGRVNGINNFQRQARMQIADGIVDGTINSREAARLLGFAERIEVKENRYLRNGRMTAGEERELKEDLAVLGRMIRHEKYDGNAAPVDERGRGRF